LAKSILLWILGFFLIPLAAQMDSSYYGTRQYFASLQVASVSKTRVNEDSFSFGSYQVETHVGYVLRRQKILRPFGSVGLNYFYHRIGTFFPDSALLLLAPSIARGMQFQPELGLEISPEERWFFRLSVKLPVTLLARTTQTELLNRFHLLQGQQYQFQKQDLRYCVEVGKDLLHQKCDAAVGFAYGTQQLYRIPTFDLARAFSMHIALRYHFGTL
jgi:hypothetical protein